MIVLLLSLCLFLQGVFDYILNNSGEANHTTTKKGAFEILGHVADETFCERAHGYDLPKWMNETIYNKMLFIRDIGFHLWAGANGDIPRARIAGGNLLALLLDRMRDADKNSTVEERKDLRMFVYSGVGPFVIYY